MGTNNTDPSDRAAAQTPAPGRILLMGIDGIDTTSSVSAAVFSAITFTGLPLVTSLNDSTS